MSEVHQARSLADVAHPRRHRRYDGNKAEGVVTAMQRVFECSTACPEIYRIRYVLFFFTFRLYFAEPEKKEKNLSLRASSYDSRTKLCNLIRLFFFLCFSLFPLSLFTDSGIAIGHILHAFVS